MTFYTELIYDNLLKKYNMLRYFVFIAFLNIAMVGFAQDIDLYIKGTNDNYKFEAIDTQMSFEEYSLLNRNLRMKEMFYALIVPGYVHFWAKDNRLGYALLATRTVAYGELAYTYWDLKQHTSIDKWKDIFALGTKGATPYLDRRKKLYTTLMFSSFFLMSGSYVFDLIHGQYRLTKKQELIRYKYNMKLNMTYFQTPQIHGFGNELLPTVSISYVF